MSKQELAANETAREWWDALTPKGLGFPHEDQDDFDNYALNEWVPKALSAYHASQMSGLAQEAGNLIDRWDMMANDTKGSLEELDSNFCRAMNKFRAVIEQEAK